MELGEFDDERINLAVTWIDRLSYAVVTVIVILIIAAALHWTGIL